MPNVRGMPPTALIQMFPNVPLHYLQDTSRMWHHLPSSTAYSVEWMPAPFRSPYYGIQLIICSGSLQQVWKDLDCPAVKLWNHGNHSQKCPFGHSANRFTQSQFITVCILHSANELLSHIQCQLLLSFKQLTCVQRHPFQFSYCFSFCSSVTLIALKGLLFSHFWSCRCCLLWSGRSPEETEVWQLLHSRSFRALHISNFELSTWHSEVSPVCLD